MSITQHAKRIMRITAGITVMIVGVVLSVPGVPGPGLLVIFAGLSILAVDFLWARRLKTKVKEKVTQTLNKVREKTINAKR
jgi:uncharacterized protein (TIGR02611 family)